MPENKVQVSDISFDSTEQNFQHSVLDESCRRLVLCDISVDWCAPCRVLMPILDEVASLYQGRFLLSKVDADENMRIAGKYRIRGFPTVIAFVNGQEVDRFHSTRRKSFVIEFIEKHIF